MGIGTELGITRDMVEEWIRIVELVALAYLIIYILYLVFRRKD